MITYSMDNKLFMYNKKIKLNLAYNRVLKVYDLQKEDVFDDFEKLDLSLEILVKNYRKIKKLDYKKKANIFKTIFNDYIVRSKKSNSDREKAFDFNQDADYIFASFFMDYGIDLVQEKEKLDWRKFIALFSGLSDKTKIREVMSIRAKEVPTPTKHNAKQIEAILKAKQYYALEMTEEEKEEKFQKGLDKLASRLEKRAVKQSAKN